jgi:ferrous iron transport protein A
MLARSKSFPLTDDRHEPALQPLGHARRGFRGFVARLDGSGHGEAPADLERRLLEIGFVEGAPIRVLHEGPIRGDPIAVRIGEATVALRRAEADYVFVIADD